MHFNSSSVKDRSSRGQRDQNSGRSREFARRSGGMRYTFLTLVALIACRDKALELPPPAPPPHDGVTLLQPGAPPLQVVRYHLTKGSKTSSELMCDVDVKNDKQGGPMPTLIVELETTVEDVLADGSAKLRL